jgi:hypothetical protein
MCELCQFRKLNGLRRQNSLQGGGVTLRPAAAAMGHNRSAARLDELGGSFWKNARTDRRFTCRRMTT